MSLQKRFNIFLLVAASFSSLSGCQSSQSQDLEVKVVNSSLILFNSTGRSCKLQKEGPASDSDDLQPIKAIVGRFLLTWKGANPLNLQFIRLKFNSSALADGKKSITFSGQDLAYIWAGSPVITAVPSNTVEKSSSPDCAFEVGGVPIADKSRDAFGNGSLLIYATTQDGDDTVPVQGVGYFNFSYTGVN